MLLGVLKSVSDLQLSKSGIGTLYVGILVVRWLQLRVDTAVNCNITLISSGIIRRLKSLLHSFHFNS